MPNKKDDMYNVGFDPHAAALAHLSAVYPIEMRDWAGAAALPPMEVEDTAEDSMIYWARAVGSAHLRKPEEVRKDIAAMEVIHEKLVKNKKPMLADGVESDLKQARAWLLFAEGKYDDAVEAMRPIADKEDSLGDEPEGIPAREMMADMLLEAKRPQQALVEYQTDLKLHPNRFDGLYGAAQAAAAGGKTSDANEYYAILLKVCDGSNSTRPELTRAKQLLAQK
jgi:tetratricopeptide (TPR) repeat protein